MAGVFKVVCVPKNGAYFTDSVELSLDMARMLKKLYLGIFKNEQLVKDFNLFGLNNFRFKIVVSGREYFDEQKRKAALDLAKKSWSGYLYQ